MSLTDTQKVIPFPAAGGIAAAVARLCFPAAFVFADSGMLIFAATVSHWLPGTADEPFWQGFLPGTRFVYPLVFWLVSLVALQVFGFYDCLRMVLRNSELADLYAAFTVGIVLTLVVTVLVADEPSPAVYMVTWLVAPPAIAVGRGLVRRLRRQIYPTSTFSVPVLVLGQGEDSGGYSDAFSRCRSSISCRYRLGTAR